jgi:hypothetical protein
MVGPTIDELRDFMDEDGILPEELGGIYLGYQLPYTRGLLCFECASQEDLDEVKPQIVSGTFECASCGIEAGDVYFEEDFANDDDETSYEAY